MIIHLHWLTLHLIIAALSIATVKAWFATTSIHSIRHESLHWSTTHTDLWDANALQNEWPSALPLPQNCQASLAERARSAMTGCPPPALEGRLKVNFSAFDVHWEHVDPPVLTIDNFLTEEECDNLLSMTNVSPPQGAGRVIQMESRTSASNRVRSGDTSLRRSTTWYVRYAAPQVVPLLRAAADLLPSISVKQMEEVQLVRYQGETQGFGWHEDALDEGEVTSLVGGQRIATLLVYLDECRDGRTLFRDLRGSNNKRLGVSPQKGRALLFFPAITKPTMLSESALNIDFGDPRLTFGSTYFDGTMADHRTAHAGEPPSGETNGGRKHIAQLWIHSLEHTPVVFGRGLNRHEEVRL